MHDSHIKNLRAMKIQLDQVIFNNETVTINNEQFREGELVSLDIAVCAAINRQVDSGSEHDRMQPKVQPARYNDGGPRE